MARKKNVLSIAVVVRNSTDITAETTQSGRPDGDWGSFVGTNRAEVIERAIKARNRWHARNFGPYRILVGELGGEITTPVTFKEVAL